MQSLYFLFNKASGTYPKIFFVKNLYLIVETYSSKRKVSICAQTFDDDCCAHLHLLGFCLLMRAHGELHGVLKEQKVCEAVRCFFRWCMPYTQLVLVILSQQWNNQFGAILFYRFLPVMCCFIWQTILHAVLVLLSSFIGFKFVF